MPKAIFKLAFIIFITFIYACSADLKSRQQKYVYPAPVTGNQSACKRSSEMENLQREIANGSEKAFLELLSHYEYCKYDLSGYRKTLKEGVRHNISGAKRQYGTFVTFSSDSTGMTKESCKEGISYLDAAVGEGDSLAPQELKEAKDRCSIF